MQPTVEGPHKKINTGWRIGIMGQFTLPKILPLFTAMAFACLCACPVVAQESDGVLSSSPLLAGEDIAIGMSLPLTGPTAKLGQDLLQGVQRRISETNALGGVHGRKIRLIALDDGYEPTRTLENTRRLLEQERVFLLMGYLGTPTSQVALPVARRAGVPFLAPFTGAQFLRQPYSSRPGANVVLNVRASYHDETEAMVRYLTEVRHLRRIGVLMQNDAFGNDGRAGVQKALAARGLDIAAVAKYERNSSDISAAYAKLHAAHPEAVILISTYNAAVPFVQQARHDGWNPIFLTISFVGTQHLAAALGQQGDGVIITQVMPSPARAEHPLVKAYMAQQPAGAPSPTHVMLEGYFAAAALDTMLHNTGPTLSRAGLMATAEGLGNFELMGIPLRFTPTDHSGNHSVFFTRLEKGVPTPFQPF